MPKQAGQLRREYALKLDERNSLLDKLRKDIPMTRSEKEAAWVVLSDLANCLSRRHYKKRQWTLKDSWYLPPDQWNQDNYDRHTDRMLIILEFMKGYNDLDMNLVISRLKTRVTWIELCLEARYLGINLELGDVAKAHTKPTIRDIIHASRLHKKIGITKPISEVTTQYAYETYKTTGRFPTFQRLALFTSRYFKYAASKRICTPTFESDLPENVFETLGTDSNGTWIN